MHEELKALLIAGWSFGMHSDGNAYRATAKRGDLIARTVAPEPLEALARAMIEAQALEMPK